MNIPGVINLSQAAAQRVDAVVGAIIRLAAALESHTAALEANTTAMKAHSELVDVAMNGPRG